jgi:signal transduction histidine kinase
MSMTARMTVFKKVLLVGLAPVAAFVGLFFAVLLPQFEHQYLQSKKDGAQDVVEMALSLAQAQAARARAGEITQPQAQQATLRAVNAMRYQGGTNYVFILDASNLRMLANPLKPELNGTVASDPADAGGFNHYQALRDAAARPGGGFVPYVQTMSVGPVRLKIGYAQCFKDWNWVFSSGVYVDPVKADLARLAWKTAIPLGLLACLVTAAASLVAGSIVKPFRSLVADLERSDLTTRLPVRGQDEFGELTRAFNAYNKLSKLNADFAHELRTPLQALRLEVESLAQDPRRADLEDRLGTVVSSLDQVLALSEQMLFLARAEDPATRIQKEPLDAVTFLVAALAPFEALAEENGVALQLQVEPGMTLRADPLLATRAVRNLVSNALRSAPEHTRIAVSLEREGRELALCVDDQGPGMSPDLLARVGQRFIRPDAARPGQHGGSGLGLAIVQGIMTLHGGKLQLQDAPGGGTRARLRFPAS